MAAERRRASAATACGLPGRQQRSFTARVSAGNSPRGLRRIAVGLVTLLLLYPFAGLFAPVDRWIWGGEIGATDRMAAITSLGLTAVAMLVVVILGIPVALYIARCHPRERTWWLAGFLASILLPPLALGLLYSIAFGSHALLGRVLLSLGLPTTNSAFAFVATQVYVSAGYFIVGSVAAIMSVPVALEQQAGLLGASPWRTFWAITLPLALPGMAAALSLAWARAIGEFGAVMISAYYPASMPVQLWTNLQDTGLPAVMPLLLIF